MTGCEKRMKMNNISLRNLDITLCLGGRLLDSLSTWLHMQVQSYLPPSFTYPTTKLFNSIKTTNK
jgi:hypothetical protein